jgi:hypothetical protein
VCGQAVGHTPVSDKVDESLGPGGGVVNLVEKPPLPLANARLLGVDS